MPKPKILRNRLLVYLFSLYLVGFVFGVITNPGSYKYENSDKNFFIIFFSNYWYLFLIWIFGLSFLGYIVTTLIIFFRAFIFGVLVKVLVINNFHNFIILFILELLIFLPTLIVLSFISLRKVKDSLKVIIFSHSETINFESYLNLMLIVTGVIAIYSLIIYLN